MEKNKDSLYEYIYSYSTKIQTNVINSIFNIPLPYPQNQGLNCFIYLLIKLKILTVIFKYFDSTIQNSCLIIDHFTVVCLVTWPLNESEAGVDLV